MTGIILGIGNSAALFAPKGTPFDPKDVIELVDPEQPHVSVFDLSVLRGDGIFEATTVWKGFPVSLENHLRRLATSAAMTDLPEPNIDAFTAAVNTVIAAYDDPEPGPMLRILVSRGYDPTTGVGPYHACFRANTGAACSETSTSISSCLSRFRNSISSFSSGVRLSAAFVEPLLRIPLHPTLQRGTRDAVLRPDLRRRLAVLVQLHDLPLELPLVMTGTIRIGHDDQLLRCHVPHEPVQYIVANPVL